MKSPSPAAAGALSLILGTLLGIWASGYNPLLSGKSVRTVAPLPVPARHDPPEPAAQPARPAEGERWSIGSFAEIPDTIRSMRRQHMPESARRELLLAEMMRLVSRDGYNEEEFSRCWELVGFDERSLVSSVRLETLARVRPGELAGVLRRGGPALLPEAETALGGMARTDPSAALQLLSSLKKQGLAVNGAALYSEWARHEGAAALAAARKLNPGKDRDRVLNASLQGWLMGDPEAAAAELVKFRDASGAETAFSSDGMPADWASEMTFQALNGGDASGVLRKVWDALEGKDRPQLVSSGFSALAAADPDEAMRLWSGLPQDFLRKNGRSRGPAGASMEGMVEGLAWADTGKAVEFITGGPAKERLTGRDRNYYRAAFDAAGDMMAGNASGKAAELADALLAQNVSQLTAERSLAVSIVRQAALNADTEAEARAVLAGVKESSAQSEAIIPVMSQLAFRNGGGIEPGEFLGLINEPSAKINAANEYAANLLTIDFKKAVEWASENEASYPGTVKSIFDTWGSYDEPGRSEMVNALDPADRQELIPNLAENLASTQPHMAVAWACSMEDTPERNSTLARVVDNARRAGASLDMLVSGSGLSVEDRTFIQQTWSNSNLPR